MSDSAVVMEVDGLEKHFSQTSNIIDKLKSMIARESQERVRAVDGVDLTLKKNQVQGVIGESGCGKSTLLETLMGMHTPTGGNIVIGDKPMTEFTKSDWKEYRRRVQIIFQDPFTSLDPKLRVRQSLLEPLRVHNIDDKTERITDALGSVRLTPPEEFLDQYPSQLSGGEKQRVAIARALVMEPDILLADEPVSMLDVSTQAAILQLLDDLSKQTGISICYISHDLSTVSYVCDRVNVMYLGRIVESAATEEIIRNPQHPYTRALINANPIPSPYYDRTRSKLEGAPSDPIGLPTGCRFKDRCPERMDICDTTPLYRPFDAEADHQVACHLHYDHDEVTGDDRE